MGIDVNIQGGLEGSNVDVTPKGELVTVQERRLKFDPEFHPFLNGDFGGNMNQNVAFSGTPDGIHDGTDRSLYTASSVSGSKFTFNKDDTHARQGIITVIQFANLNLEKVTIGIDGSDTDKTEGTDWNEETSNTVTATNIATAISTITGVTATSSGAVVTVVADAGFDITKIDTDSAGGDMTATGQSVEVDNGTLGDTMQFAKGSDLTLANFSAISLDIFVDKNWAEGDSMEIYGYDTGLNADVGVRVPLESFFTFSDFDTWQSVAIPLTVMGIEASTIVDAFRITIAAKSGAGPTFYLDRLQVEETGTPITFVATRDGDVTFHVDEIRIAIADALDTSTLTDPSMPELSFNKMLGVSQLANGITFRRVQDGDVQFSATFRQLGDFLATGSNLINVIGDGTNTFITLLIEFPEPIILTGSISQNFLAFTISDDLSGLLQFTAAARGAVVMEKLEA